MEGSDSGKRSGGCGEKVGLSAVEDFGRESAIGAGGTAARGKFGQESA